MSFYNSIGRHSVLSPVNSHIAAMFLTLGIRCGFPVFRCLTLLRDEMVSMSPYSPLWHSEPRQTAAF